MGWDDWEEGDEPESLGEVTVIRETRKAILVDSEDHVEIWVPRSVVHFDSEIESDAELHDSGELIVKSWFARKECLA